MQQDIRPQCDHMVIHNLFVGNLWKTYMLIVRFETVLNCYIFATVQIHSKFRCDPENCTEI